MVWCQGAQNIGLSSRKPKSALMCTVWPQCTHVPDRQTDRQTDRRTDRRTNITAIARLFVLTNASRAKKTKLRYKVVSEIKAQDVDPCNTQPDNSIRRCRRETINRTISSVHFYRQIKSVVWQKSYDFCRRIFSAEVEASQFLTIFWDAELWLVSCICVC